MASKGWRILAVLAAPQFLMVLDQAVMNVSISQLVSDFHTDVTTIQAVIALPVVGDGCRDGGRRQGGRHPRSATRLHDYAQRLLHSRHHASVRARAD